MALEQLSDLSGRALGGRDRRVARGIGKRPPSRDVVADGEAFEAADVHRPADRVRASRSPKRSEKGAHRVEAVVRHLARPHQVPERVAELWRESAARGGKKLGKERRASRLQNLTQPVVDRTVWACLGRRPKEREVFGK